MRTVSQLNDRMLNTANTLTHVLNWGFLAGLVICWGRIPEQVPQYFNAAGQIDGYGDKSILIVLVVFSFFIYGMHWFTMYITPRMTDEKQVFGLTAKNVGKASAEEQERALLYVLNAIAWTDVMLFAGFIYMTVCAALCRDLGSAWTPACLFSFLLPFLYYMYRWNKLRRQVIARDDKI